MRLNELSDRAGANKVGRRVGRGIGSGRGKTSGRGHKGQKSRAGVHIKGFEGGQMPLYRRLPKRGFKNALFRKHFEAVNLGRLQSAIEAGRIKAGAPITEAILAEAGLARGRGDGMRLLAKGEIKSAINVEVTGASRAAIAAVEAAGGTVKVTGKSAEKKAPSDKKSKGGEGAKEKGSGSSKDA
jgi:large subunit ribosomal protein L15